MFESPAYAQAAGQTASTGSTIFFLGQFVVIGLIFYFLLIRPQQKRVKQHRDMIAAAKKGDQVVTGGGLVGKVTKVDEQFVEVEIAPNVRVKAVKATLSDITPAGATKPAND